MATPNPIQNTAPQPQPPKVTEPTQICPTCISGIHPTALRYLDILKR